MSIDVDNIREEISVAEAKLLEIEGFISASNIDDERRQKLLERRRRLMSNQMRLLEQLRPQLAG